ncbi:hypothetical protein CR513_11489, partial [Mucuna pruriens]
MSVAVVNNSTVTDFINNSDEFDSFVNEWFAIIDEDGDGKLSCDEIHGRLGMLLPLGSESQPQPHHEILNRFDEDGNGALDPKEFKSLMTEIMHAFARGIGGSPILLVLGNDTLLVKAVQYEASTFGEKG